MSMNDMPQADQQQQETLERERLERQAMGRVADALLGEDPGYTAWLDSQAQVELERRGV